MWNYAELSQVAKVFGGPEKYVEKVFSEGVITGRISMFPWIIGTACVSSVLTIIGIKIYKTIKLRHKLKKLKYEKELLEQIKCELEQEQLQETIETNSQIYDEKRLSK